MTVDHEDRSAPTRLTRRPGDTGAPPRRGALIGKLVDAIRRGDDKAVEQAVVQLSQRKRWLAPLALIVGAFIMLFQGVKLLYTNWRLAVVQIIPAMWIWLAMLDIKLHVLHGKQFHVIRGPLLIPCIIGVTALTAASFYLNGVFAFAISVPGKPEIRPSFARANLHLRVILAWGCAVGLALSFSALITTRWGHWPFVISQSIVVGVMMLCYVAVPARLVGVEKKARSRRDALAATAVGGAVGGVVCSPPYMLGRVGILMLGWPYVFWLGIILIVVGVTLQTGATSAVKAVKFSAKLVGHPGEVAEPAPAERKGHHDDDARVVRHRHLPGAPRRARPLLRRLPRPPARPGARSGSARPRWTRPTSSSSATPTSTTSTAPTPLRCAPVRRWWPRPSRPIACAPAACPRSSCWS